MDHFWLYNEPAYPNAVQWSQDNLLAVAAAHSVVILSPADLAGPRAFTVAKEFDVGPLQVDAVPRNYPSNWRFQFAAIIENTIKEQNLVVRSLSWSPLGCTQQGGCVLAVLTNDHKVRG